MGRRGRVTAAALLLLAGLLFAGRWLAGFLAERWWLLATAPGGTPFHTRRALLAAFLDGLVTLLATLWWVGHGLALGRTAARVEGQAGNPIVRRALSGPDAAWWIVVLGLALGLVTGVGAGRLADPVLLAWEGARFSLADPAGQVDAAWYLAGLPLWLRVHAWVTAVGVATLAIALVTHLLSGAIQVGRGRLGMSAGVRRQVGLLLVLLAAVIATHQVLLPRELAAGIPRVVNPNFVELHRTAAFFLVGVALAVLALTLVWMLRPMHGLLAGGWLALGAAMVGVRYLVPTGGAWPASSEEADRRAEFERAAYGYEVTSSPAASSAGPSLWTPVMAGRLARHDSAAGLVAVPLVGGPTGIWVAPGRPEGDRVALVGLAADSVGPGGAPLLLDPAGTLAAAPGRAFMRLTHPAVYPGAPRVARGAGDAGISLAGGARRLLLAWAWQSGALVGGGGARAGWRMDPVERLGHLAPFASWTGLRARRVNGELTWMADGIVTADAFPLVRRVPWGGRRVAYARAGFLGLVDARSGRARILLRADADSLSAAWARVAGDLVEPPAAAEPSTYPSALLELHAALWMADERARAGRPAEAIVLATSPAEIGPGRPLPVVDEETERLLAVLEGGTASGRPVLHVYRPTSGDADAPAVYEREWHRFPFVLILHDSVAARGGGFLPGPVQVLPDGEEPLVYQPMWAHGSAGDLILAAVGAGRGRRLGTGRSLGEALERLSGDRPGASGWGSGSGESAVLADARRWLREADSALARGDLVAFARAFAALRNLLVGPPMDRGGRVP